MSEPDGEDHRPLGAAKILDWVAEYFDGLDAALRAAGHDGHEGGEVQADLRMMASWLQEHPDVDSAMTACLLALPKP